MNGRFGLVAVATAMACSAFAPIAARADSGEFNLHIEPSIGIPVAGDVNEVLQEGDRYPLFIPGWIGFDWQLSPPFAIEVLGNFGYALPPRIMDVEGEGSVIFGLAAGVRYRFLDNQEGYGNEENGDYDGNFWGSAHLGFEGTSENVEFAIDLGGGYEWSVLRPLSIGPFIRGQFLFGEGKMDVLLYGGISFSIAFGGAQAVDTDGDSLSDEREVAEHQTDPNNPDTDGDQLNDGLEVRTETNPRSPDTDGDELTDGAEDANQSGGLDAGESDPRDNDSDDGGVPDGWERANPPHDPRNPADDDSDRDRVLDNADQCPDTPQGVEVDPRGCTILRATMVLAGINFEFNSDQITANSEVQLQTAAQLLRDNPTATVEIGGHTDNVGSASYNRDLSGRRAASVKNWLVAHGIEASRMTTRGYGSQRPAATNDTDEGRAQNRRIEFRRTDAGAAQEGQPVQRQD